MHTSVVSELTLLFIISVIVVLICTRFKLPSIVGFLLTGVFCGPSMLGIINNMHVVDTVAEIGVAFLMFSIGMELSGKELFRMKKPMLIGGSLQVFLTIFIVILAYTWITEFKYCVIVGCMVALSSTAIVLSLLQQKGQSGSPHGRVCLAILIFQDLAIVPMVLLIPLLAGNAELDAESMLMATGKGAAVLVAIFLFAKYILPHLMFYIVKTKSRDLMLMATIGICLTVALITSWIGLSLSLGAFLAGLMLAESDYNLNTMESIVPFKEVFSSVFFMSVGMLLDIQFLMNNIVLTAFIAVFIMGIKILGAIPGVLALRYSRRVALMVAFSLAQVGEFSFVLAKSALDLNLLDNNDYQIFLASSIFTMVMTPILMSMAPKIAKVFIREHTRAHEGDDEEEESHDNGPIRDGRLLKDHLIVIGYGIGGQIMAQGARDSGIPYIICEMNPDTVKKYKKSEPIIHGDASFPLVLEHLGVEKAKVLTILISDPSGGQFIISNARAANPTLHIIVRTRYHSNIKRYKEMGADEVIPEEFETSLEIYSRILNRYLVPRQTIDQYIDGIRKRSYGMSRQLGSGNNVMESMPDLQLSAFSVQENCPAVDKTLQEIGLHEKYGVYAAGLRRNGEVHTGLNATTKLLSGDTVYLMASNEALTAVAGLFCTKKEKYSEGKAE